jgi:hypothetical protein
VGEALLKPHPNCRVKTGKRVRWPGEDIRTCIEAIVGRGRSLTMDQDGSIEDVVESGSALPNSLVLL